MQLSSEATLPCRRICFESLRGVSVTCYIKVPSNCTQLFRSWTDHLLSIDADDAVWCCSKYFQATLCALLTRENSRVLSPKVVISISSWAMCVHVCICVKLCFTYCYFEWKFRNRTSDNIISKKNLSCLQCQPRRITNVEVYVRFKVEHKVDRKIISESYCIHMQLRKLYVGLSGKEEISTL